MKVTVKIAEVKNEKTKYPVLMRSNATGNEVVYLFINNTTGVCVVGDNGFNKVGTYDDDLISATNRDIWKKFEGTITLENG